ncbi:MAG: hypothetical protein B7Y25_01010 [Alphaproteobacteria bacterium 16-39-46]|nr:MAG: hypothetical protein B7Y25_01010 [Alphaproteobacteria bacterium 16-39-46]OZA44204.1 MAG: hypothetical protein B7X84_01090 [Alphaproteobacteria bacterium 17-39-52]HQS93412.1 hypothetical protein [Alphaproteobacteria bacterium]
MCWFYAFFCDKGKRRNDVEKGFGKMQTQNRLLDEIAGMALKALGRLDKLGDPLQKMKDLCELPEKFKSLEKEIEILSQKIDASEKDA